MYVYFYLVLVKFQQPAYGVNESDRSAEFVLVLDKAAPIDMVIQVTASDNDATSK